MQILGHAEATIERGDKIALIGANGKGKSTLLRIIAGTESHEGESQLGFNVNLAFYAQHQLEALTMENEILEELKQSGIEKTELELRQVLGCFLFTGDDVFKKIKVLSGGEKSRVALAKTLISESNFLLLDEPTNHLDFLSENILIQALQQYAGTFLLVSHNRHFISKVANKIWYIEDRKIKSYPGTFEEFNYWQTRQQTREGSQATQAKPSKASSNDRASKRSNSNEEREYANLQKELNDLENSIQELEEQKNAKEVELSKEQVYSNPDLLLETNQTYQRLEAELNDLNKKWEVLAEKIDAFERRL